MKSTFRFGVHPHNKKELTQNLPFETMPIPEKLYFPISQHIGASCTPVVNVGDYVKVGSLIAQANGFISANIHSSVSGKVEGFVFNENVFGAKIRHIVILNDYKYETDYLKPLVDPTPQDIIKRSQDAGLVGMGGATFPTHVKLSLKVPIHTLIINGAECEPYITADYRLMLEHTQEIINGILLLGCALKATNIIIGIEDNKIEAIDALTAKAPSGIKVVSLKTKYPQGGEKQLIYAIAKQKVPSGGLPSDIGFVVLNISTALALNDAVNFGIPSHSRYMTVSGLGIKRPANLYVATGIPNSKIVEYLGSNDNFVKVVSGGPMMGLSQASLNAVVTKGSSALLLLTKDEIRATEPSPCINCGKCAKVCPMRLMPMNIDAYTLKNELALAKKYSPSTCIECGSCAFVCPAKRPLVQSIKLAKKLIRERGI